MIILDTPDQIDMFRLLALKGALTLECKVEYEGCADYLTAGKLANAARDLVIVAETLNTVHGAATRKGLVIVNKVKEEDE
jgi:hypothetical protein